MKPYLVRKCSGCGNWHIHEYFEIGPFVYFRTIATFESFWDVGIVLINFPELIKS